MSELVAASDNYNLSFLPAFALLSDGRVVGAWEEATFALDGAKSDTRRVVILDDRGASFAGA